MNLPPGYRTFTSAEVARFLTHLQSKAGELKNCEVCGNLNWTVFGAPLTPQVLVVNEQTGQLKALDASSFSLTALSCKTCGNVKFFENYYLGFELDPPTKSEDKA